MKMWEIVVLFLLLIPVIAYLGLKYHYDYWKRRQIPYVASNIFDLGWYELAPVEHYAKIYHQLKGHKFGGLFARYTPMLMIRDLELINRIFIKDFAYFQDRNDVVFNINEPTSHNIFSAPGSMCKNLRKQMTPMFTSGKIKSKFSLVQHCAKELSEEVAKRVETNDILDVKDMSSRYTVEIMTMCVFGLKTNAIRDNNSKFLQISKQIYARSPTAKFLLFTQGKLAWLKKILRLHFTNKPTAEFFSNLAHDLIDQREASIEEKNDFFQFFINMRNKNQSNMKLSRDELVMNDDAIIGNSFLFFFGGYETSSYLLSLALYELATNTTIQKKLQEEIDEYCKKHDNNITYDMIKYMPYLHQVLSETLRKYPVLGTLGRFCVQNYKIPGTEVVIEKGTEVLIPIAGLHSDPEYFPNPEKFDPDRFQNPYFGRNMLFPFGLGPRNCIGGRFAQINIKLALVYLLRDFTLETCSKTSSPIRFKPFKPVSTIIHGVLLKFSSRK